MSQSASQVVFHNYPQSPVAEKVRVVFGMKQLNWQSVVIPRLAPKPLLTVLTGGYRRTPVMQMGADIYCDSRCIIQELDRRFPENAVLPAQHYGLLNALNQWADGGLFDLSVKIVLGSAGDALPADFAHDRGRLYFGPDWKNGLTQANESLYHTAAQMQAALDGIDQHLADGKRYLVGDNPTALDAQVYHVVWFLRGRWNAGPDFLSAFNHIEQWEQRIKALGHGTFEELSPEAAITLAENSVSNCGSGIVGLNPQQLTVGQRVSVCADVDGGETPVIGCIHYADAQRIALKDVETAKASVCVHFPRAGYRVVPL
jgi:glutathione S-transferase